jgi:hypothetical protein
MRSFISLFTVFGLTAFAGAALAQAEPPPPRRPDEGKRDKRPEDFKRPFDRPPPEGKVGERIEEVRRMIERLERELEEIRRHQGEFGEKAGQFGRRAGEIAKDVLRDVREAGKDVRMLIGRPFGPVRKEKAAYLGVAAGPVPAALRSHLKLAAGTGMAVEFVEPDSPAKAAGIQQHDILLKLDDQILINAHQLAVLVRIRKAGDTVSLTLLREGRQTAVPVKLTEKELPVLEEHGPFGMPFGEGPFPRMLPLPEGGGAGGGFGPGWRDGRIERFFAPDGEFQMVFSDGEHSLQISGRREGERKLTARTADGKIVFEGPIGTPEQRKAIPEEIARKLQMFEGLMGGRGFDIELEFGRPPRDGAPRRPVPPGEKGHPERPPAPPED